MKSPHPAHIGRYRVERALGRGAMGMVYQAEDPDIGRRVAIKLVRADLLQGKDRDEFLIRFRHEARAVGRCPHPNIVALYDLSHHEGNPFLAMEYVDGIDLARALRERGRFSPAEAIATMTQVLDALGAAHDAGIVHRDVKPANILLQSNGRVKVTDFGISHLSTSDLTEQGAVLGTLTYMSPEQCCGKEIDLRSDLFSVGSVLYELLSGVRAFRGRNASEVARQLLSGEPQDLATLVPGLPGELIRVVRKSMAKSRDARYASARAMVDALISEDNTVHSRPPEAMTVAVPEKPGVEPAVTAAHVDAAALQRVERCLAFYIGPIARHVVRGAARSATSVEELCETVAQYIDPLDEREQFLTACLPGERRRQTQIQAETGTPDMQVGTITAEQIERAQRALANVLGPIAKMMVRRVLPEVGSEAALWERLAASIEDASDRGEFLRQRAGQPAGRTRR